MSSAGLKFKPAIFQLGGYMLVIGIAAFLLIVSTLLFAEKLFGSRGQLPLGVNIWLIILFVIFVLSMLFGGIDQGQCLLTGFNC